MDKYMRRIILFLVAWVVVGIAQGQTVNKYWVTLRDKAGSMYSLDNPSAFLGPRALERRDRLGIALDSLDLPVSEAYIVALRQAGFRVQNRSKWLNGVAVFADSTRMAALLDSMPFVVAYQLCDSGTLYPPETEVMGGYYPVDYVEYENAFDHNYYNWGYDQIRQLHGDSLHSAGYQGEGMLIGVCDGGFPGVDSIAFFDTLRAEGRLVATRDFVWLGDNVYNVHSHGTMVLSTMATYLPGFYVGTAPKASYILCRTENTTSETLLEEYNWVAAAEYLDSMGADVVTTSLGYFYFDDSTQNHTLRDLDGRTAPITLGAEVAVSRGMVVVNSAGNEGQSIPQHLGVPADGEHVLTVGAVDEMGDWASFSSYGPTWDFRIKPDVMALGSYVPCAASTGKLVWSSGTSFSGPIIAGMMACVRQRYPMLSPEQLCDSVRSWCDSADTPGRKRGYGIPDFSKAVGDTTYMGIADRTIDAVAIYPNPANDYFVIDANIERQSEMMVINMLGREMMRKPIVKGITQVNISSLPKGIYFIRIANTTFCQKLVKK